MSAGPPSRQVYYNKARAASFVVGAAFWVFVAIVVVIHPGHGTALDRALGAVIIAGGIALMIRCALCVVIAEPEALTVRNPLRSHRIPWGEITAIYQDAYGFGAGGAATVGPVVSVARREGRRSRRAR